MSAEARPGPGGLFVEFREPGAQGGSKSRARKRLDGEQPLGDYVDAPGLLGLDVRAKLSGDRTFAVHEKSADRGLRDFASR